RTVYVDGALRCTGGTAGEVEQRRVVGGGGLDRRFLVGCVHPPPEVECFGWLLAGLVVVDYQDVPHRWQSITDPCDLALVDRPRGYQHIGLPDVHSGGNRLRPEGRKQR